MPNAKGTPFPPARLDVRVADEAMGAKLETEEQASESSSRPDEHAMHELDEVEDDALDDGDESDDIDSNTNYLPYLRRLAAEERKRANPILEGVMGPSAVLGRRRMRERIEAELERAEPCAADNALRSLGVSHRARLSPAMLRVATAQLLVRTERAAQRIARETVANFLRER